MCPLSFEFKRSQIGCQRPLTRPGTFNDKRLLLSIQDDSVILMRLFLCSYNKHNTKEIEEMERELLESFVFPLSGTCVTLDVKLLNRLMRSNHDSRL